MSDYVCGFQTHGVRYVDPEPAEYCMAEVEYEDDRCPKHDEDDDRSDEIYDRYLDEKYEREHYPEPNYSDDGD